MQNKPPIEIKGVLNRDTCLKLHNFIDTDPIAFKEGYKTIWYNTLHKKMGAPFAQVEHALNTVRFSGQKSVLDYYGEYSYPENTQLIFPSTDDYFHGVKEVRNSKRYTITTWYAGDIKYVE